MTVEREMGTETKREGKGRTREIKSVIKIMHDADAFDVMLIHGIEAKTHSTSCY